MKKVFKVARIVSSDGNALPFSVPHMIKLDAVEHESFESAEETIRLYLRRTKPEPHEFLSVITVYKDE